MRYKRTMCAVVLATAASCGDSSGSEPDGSVSDASVAQAQLRAEALRNLGENVVLPSYQSFAEEASSLAAALATYAADPSAVHQTNAQMAFEEAMAAWQRAEMMQLGPLAAMGLSSGGEDRRDEIYAWPLENTCSVDQLTVSDDFATATALSARPVNTRGLGVIEYLLHAPSADNTCSPLANINQDGTWDGFGDEQIVARRASQAAALAELVQSQADALVNRWATGAFLLELTDPTRAGALYGSAQEGLNEISSALFYLDKQTKDMKLAGPLGITCDQASTCPELRESRFANRSKERVIANLEAFQDLYHGGPVDGPEVGFKELLDSMGATTFATDMSRRIDAALTAVRAIDGPFVDALETDEARDAHTAVTAVTTDLKGMFVGVLDFETPNCAAGDND